MVDFSLHVIYDMSVACGRGCLNRAKRLRMMLAAISR